MRHSRFCLIPLLLLFTGCADDGHVPTFPATGVVRYPDGTPLVGGAILCESPHGLAARATINDDGTFQLGTYDVDDGAVEGTHKVAIRPPRPGNYNPDAGVAPPPTIEARFFSMDTSGIEFEVTAAGPNHFTIEVTRQRGR
jgi:hypothetical protein